MEDNHANLLDFEHIYEDQYLESNCRSSGQVHNLVQDWGPYWNDKNSPVPQATPRCDSLTSLASFHSAVQEFTWDDSPPETDKIIHSTPKTNKAIEKLDCKISTPQPKINNFEEDILDAATQKPRAQLTAEKVMEMLAEEETKLQSASLATQRAIMATQRGGSRQRRVRGRPVTRRAYSSSPRRTGDGGASVGLDHLDNLVCLMEQLGVMSEENRVLRRRCTYLHDTKMLLRLQNKTLLNRDIRAPRNRTRSSNLKSPKHDVYSKHAMYSSDSSDSDVEYGGFAAKPRSSSLGSLDIIEFTDHDFKIIDGKNDKNKENRDTAFSRSMLNRWQRVKKVFSGKAEPQALSKHPESNIITAERLVRANTRHTSMDQAAKLSHLKSSKSCDYGLLMPPISTDDSDTSRKTSAYSCGDAAHSQSSGPSMDSHPGVVAGCVLNVVPDTETCGDAGTHTSAADSGLELEGHSMGSSVFSEDGSTVEMRTDSRHAMPGVERTISEESRAVTSPEGQDCHFLSVTPAALPRRKSYPFLTTDQLSIPTQHSFPDFRECSVYDGSLYDPVRSKSADETAIMDMLAATEDSSTNKAITGDSGVHRKTSRSTWGRVKHIIHNRKDSLKRRRSRSAGDKLTDGCSLSDGEISIVDDIGLELSICTQDDQFDRRGHQRGHGRGRGRKSMSTPVSPEHIRTMKKLMRHDTTPVNLESALMHDASGNKNDRNFEKECDEFTEDFIRKMEEWENIKGLDVIKSPAASSEILSSTAELLSASFTRKVREWQRVKRERRKGSTSPSQSDYKRLNRSQTEKPRASRKKERSKSTGRAPRVDRSSNKLDKQREKELQRIEKKEQKIEKEREKLNKMKKQLEHIDRMSESEVQGMSQEFAQRMREWEIMQGRVSGSAQDGGGCIPELSPKAALSPASLGQESESRQFTESTRHSRSNSDKQYSKRERQRTNSEVKEDVTHPSIFETKPSTEGILGDNNCAESPQPHTISSHAAYSRSDSAPLLILASSHPRLESHSPCVESPDSAEVFGLEHARWLETELVVREGELRQKEEELQKKNGQVAALQHETDQLTQRINAMARQDQLQIEHHRREVWVVSRGGHYSTQCKQIEGSLLDLRQQLTNLQEHNIQADTYNQHLQGLLTKEVEAQMDTERQSIAPLQNGDDKTFEQVFTFLLKLHAQLGELKLGINEREGLVQDLKRRLVLKDVSTRLLTVELQRRQLDLAHCRQARHTRRVRRRRTYAGMEISHKEDTMVVDTIAPYDMRIPTQSEDSVRAAQHCLDMEDLSTDWLHEIARHRHILKAPAAHEDNLTQTEAVTSCSTSMQTSLTIDDKNGVLPETVDKLVQTSPIPDELEEPDKVLGQHTKVAERQDNSSDKGYYESKSHNKLYDPTKKSSNVSTLPLDLTRYKLDKKRFTALSDPGPRPEPHNNNDDILTKSRFRTRTSRNSSGDNNSNNSDRAEITHVSTKPFSSPAAHQGKDRTSNSRSSSMEDYISMPKPVKPPRVHRDVEDKQASDQGWGNITPIKPPRVRHIGIKSPECISQQTKSAHKPFGSLTDSIKHTDSSRFFQPISQPPSCQSSTYGSWHNLQSPKAANTTSSSSSSVVYSHPSCLQGQNTTPFTSSQPTSPIYSPDTQSNNLVKLRMENSYSHLYTNPTLRHSTPSQCYKQIGSSSDVGYRTPDASYGTYPGRPKDRSRSSTKLSVQLVNPSISRDGKYSKSDKESYAKTRDTSKLNVPVYRSLRDPSPSNIRPIHSPIHHLKSADQLLHESDRMRKHQYHSKSSSLDKCTSIPVTYGASNKENSSQNSSNVQHVISRLSREQTPESNYNKGRYSFHGENVNLALRALLSPTPDNPTDIPPFKDRTNDGKVKKTKEDLLERLSPERVIQSPNKTRISEAPKQGTVSLRAELYENKKSRSISTPGSLSSSVHSLSDDSRPHSSSFKESSHSQRSSPATPGRDYYKVSRIFNRKPATSRSDTERGTSLDLDDAAGAEQTEKKRGFQWFQNTKRFFKTSNENLLEDAVFNL